MAKAKPRPVAVRRALEHKLILKIMKKKDESKPPTDGSSGGSTSSG